MLFMKTGSCRSPARLLRSLTAAVFSLALLIQNAPANDDVLEEAHSRTVPWSGYWWPHHQGAILLPLSKYDQLTGAKAAEWEKKHHPSGDAVPKWHGYCHAWAASAVLDREPAQDRDATREERKARLQVGDQKGLLAASHASDIANTYGDRFGDGEGSEEPQDLAPDTLWRLLNLYIKQQGVPLVLDIEAGPEVWNYPVYAYRIRKTGEREDGARTAQLSLWMADNGVTPNFVGLKARYQTFQFEYRMRNGAVVMGSAKWIGPSEKDHPDFAWYPYVVQPENPEVQYAVVRELLRLPPEPPAADPARPGSTAAPATPPATGTPPAVRPRPSQPAITPAGILPDVTMLSPVELVALMANRTSSFTLDATVDRFDGGRYAAGETFKVRVATEKPGYLYLMHVTPDGQLFQLYPQAGQDNRIAAGKTITLPAAGSPIAFLATEPVGVHRIKAIVTERPLILSGLLADPPAAESPRQQQQQKPDQETSAPSVNQQQQQTARKNNGPAKDSSPAQQSSAGTRKPQSDQERNSGKPTTSVETGQDSRSSSPESGQAQVETTAAGFRWHPTQRQQLEQWLRDYLRDEAEVPPELQSINVKQLLGPFAQDEVAIYVGPPGKAAGAKPGR